MKTQIHTHYSIEYCHIYSNQAIGHDHERSIHQLREIVETLRSEHATYSLCVMVDDYSFPESRFDYVNLSNWLELQHAKPHFTFRESELLSSADEVLECMIDGKLKRALESYVGRKRYPCSLLTAAWYLARLGKLRSISSPEITLASQLINILPRHFERSEKKARDIIRSTPFYESLDAIANHYIVPDGQRLSTQQNYSNEYVQLSRHNRALQSPVIEPV